MRERSVKGAGRVGAWFQDERWEAWTSEAEQCGVWVRPRLEGVEGDTAEGHLRRRSQRGEHRAFRLECSVTAGAGGQV